MYKLYPFIGVNPPSDCINNTFRLDYMKGDTYILSIANNARQNHIVLTGSLNPEANLFTYFSMHGVRYASAQAVRNG